MTSTKNQDGSAAMPPATPSPAGQAAPDSQQQTQQPQPQPQPQQQQQPASTQSQQAHQAQQAIQQQQQAPAQPAAVQQPAEASAQQQPQQPTQHAAAPQVASPQAAVQQQPGLAAPNAAQQQHPAVAAAAAAVSLPVNVNQPGATAPAGVSENLACQWEGCTERSPTAEALYEHVCERHVGRKSTNNLNLTCQWANCHTTTVKRDHITSHIRVHVPLKPHRCDFCGKAFKRPQDLKKHVKTHADDSVLVRSPDPGAGSQPPPNGMFNVGVGPHHNKPTHYFEGQLGAVPAGPYGGHPAPQYYQPAPHPQHQANPSYGNVYYTVGPDSHQAAYESKKRGYDALNDFLGEMKRRQFDPTSYAAVGQRLLNLHGLPLPLVNNGPTPEYHPAPAMAAVGGAHGGGYGPAPAPAPAGPPQGYHLPPMGNLRTKADVMNIDQFLEQMQSTILETDEQVAAAGVGQPGAHYVQGGMSYRTTNSPPTATTTAAHAHHHAHHPTSYHATAAATTAPAPVATSAAAAPSPHSATPALTPPSSAQSYTSGRSPISLPSAHQQSQPQPSTGMYPTLPATTAHEHAAPGYPAVTSAAPASTLSSVFDNEDRRRYTGGTLQRSRLYSASEAMDASAEGERRGSASSGTTAKAAADNLIDPALRRESDVNMDRPSTPTSAEAKSRSNHSKSPTPGPDGRPTSIGAPSANNPVWVESVRILSQVRGFVKAMWADMESREGQDAGESSQRNEHEPNNNNTGGDQDTDMDDASLYPVLKAHLEES